MEALLLEALKAVLASKASGGLLAAASTALMYLLRLLRDDAPQSYLPEKLQWKNLPFLAKLALPLLLGGGGAVLLALSTGAALLPALVQGVIAGVGAVGLNHATKAAASFASVRALAEKTLALTLPQKKQ